MVSLTNSPRHDREEAREGLWKFGQKKWSRVREREGGMIEQMRKEKEKETDEGRREKEW